MEHRDVEIIRRDIEIAQLKAANCHLQIQEHHASAAALQLEAEKLAGLQQRHEANRKKHEDELRAALEAKGEGTTLPGGQVIPMTPPPAAAGA